MKDWAEWLFIILLVLTIWVVEDPRRAGYYLSDIVYEFQQGVEDGRQGTGQRY